MYEIIFIIVSLLGVTGNAGNYSTGEHWKNRGFYRRHHFGHALASAYRVPLEREYDPITTTTTTTTATSPNTTTISTPDPNHFLEEIISTTAKIPWVYSWGRRRVVGHGAIPMRVPPEPEDDPTTTTTTTTTTTSPTTTTISTPGPNHFLEETISTTATTPTTTTTTLSTPRRKDWWRRGGGHGAKAMRVPPEPEDDPTTTTTTTTTTPSPNTTTISTPGPNHFLEETISTTATTPTTTTTTLSTPRRKDWWRRGGGHGAKAMRVPPEPEDDPTTTTTTATMTSTNSTTPTISTPDPNFFPEETIKATPTTTTFTAPSNTTTTTTTPSTTTFRGPQYLSPKVGRENPRPPPASAMATPVPPEPEDDPSTTNKRFLIEEIMKTPPPFRGYQYLPPKIEWEDPRAPVTPAMAMPVPPEPEDDPTPTTPTIPLPPPEPEGDPTPTIPLPPPEPEGDPTTPNERFLIEEIITTPSPFKGPLYLPPSNVSVCVPPARKKRATRSAKTLRLGDVKGARPIWHVGIYIKTTVPFMQICGGSVVRQDVVISAAHCFWSDLGQDSADNYAVGANKIYKPYGEAMDKRAQKSDVKEIILPHRYRGSVTSFQDDLAILKLVTPFTYARGLRPVCVDFDDDFDDQQLAEGNSGTIAGWGYTDSEGSKTQWLLWLELPFVAIETCIQRSEGFVKYITSDKICAGEFNTGKALCKGDSGGGLVFWHGEPDNAVPYLRGIASTAPSADNLKCNVLAAGSFTSINAHRRFLRKHVPGIDEDCRYRE